MWHRIQGAGPVTVAEFSLGASDGADFVDVSLVDGFNLPVRISNNKGCPTSDCPVDLNPNCEATSPVPSALTFGHDAHAQYMILHRSR